MLYSRLGAEAHCVYFKLSHLCIGVGCRQKEIPQIAEGEGVPQCDTECDKL